MPTQITEDMALTATGPAPRGRPRQAQGSAMPGVLATLRTWVERSAQRRALRELAREGRLLRDMGLTREQALREAAKPFWRR
jgi:uncharacterized protein YjiS (DUF1127 family)